MDQVVFDPDDNSERCDFIPDANVDTSSGKGVLRPLAQQAGIGRLNFQILRTTVATHAQHLGSPKDIATLMRHRRVETS